MKVFQFHEESKWHCEDMKKIMSYLRERGDVFAKVSTIERLYMDFSDDRNCAGWMVPDDDVLAEFADWLSEIDL